jgi:hypothetical protein
MRPHLNRKTCVWWHMPVNPATVRSINKIVVQAGLGKKQDPISKITRAKRAGDVVHG